MSHLRKKYFEIILNGSATETELVISLQMLSAMLDKHHGIAPVIIIDEYDTPIQQGHRRGFYDRVALFMRNFFSGGFKDNKHLSYGFMTGILRVAKESIFSGLNNVKVNSILDNRYSSYFGFTPEEVREMTRHYGVPEKYKEICEWYDGYLFGKTEIFNPWSVINYFNNECEPRAFWQSTGNNDIIGELLENATEEIYDQLNNLLQGKTDSSFGEDYMCEVSLPNREITFIYNKEILAQFHELIPQTTAVYIQQAIYTGNVAEFELQLEKLLLQSVSCYDTDMIAADVETIWKYGVAFCGKHVEITKK